MWRFLPNRNVCQLSRGLFAVLLFFRSFSDTFNSLTFGNMSVVDSFLYCTEIFYALYMCMCGNLHMYLYITIFFFYFFELQGQLYVILWIMLTDCISGFRMVLQININISLHSSSQFVITMQKQGVFCSVGNIFLKLN